MIEIKRWDNDKALHSGDFESVLRCLEDGVAKGVSFTYANLQNANLQGANLQNANLQNANLWDANLWGANLQGANLWDANLWGANLWDANLQNANLQGANLQNANLSCTAGIVYATCSFTGFGECGRTISGVVIDGDVRFFCGCFIGSKKELLSYIREGDEGLKKSRMKAYRFIMSCIKEAT